MALLKPSKSPPDSTSAKTILLLRMDQRKQKAALLTKARVARAKLSLEDSERDIAHSGIIRPGLNRGRGIKRRRIKTSRGKN